MFLFVGCSLVQYLLDHLSLLMLPSNLELYASNQFRAHTFGKYVMVFFIECLNAINFVGLIYLYMNMNMNMNGASIRLSHVPLLLSFVAF